MKAVPAAGNPQMKLLLDTRSQHVLYAEARKDVVDFFDHACVTPCHGKPTNVTP